MKFSFSLGLILLFLVVSLHAQVTFDGTLGPRVELPGPNYQIKAELGQQHGGNLFHSFNDFNINTGESATFSGPNSITNVISRVTGGNSSHIDGTLRSTIPNANFYLLNPDGIMFGNNAKLDVQGSFHASTAPYLRLGENGRFDAKEPSNTLLTVAPVTAFGFLDNPVAPISVEGGGEINQADWDGSPTGLSVLEGKTLSLIGGNLEIKKGTFFETLIVDAKDNEVIEITRLPRLSAPSGRINLASVASKGEVVLGEDFLDVSSFKKFSDIHLTNKSLLQVSGEGAGSVFIRGGQIFIDDSHIEAQTLGARDSGVVDIQGDSLSLYKDSEINVDGHGKGRGSNVILRATDSVTLISTVHKQFTNINTRVYGAGDGGNLVIEADNILLKEGSIIDARVFGSGEGSDVTLQAADSVIFSGVNRYANKEACGTCRVSGAILRNSRITTETYYQGESGGNAGKILIEADNIFFKEGTGVRSSAKGIGNASDITIRATGSVNFSGNNGVTVGGHIISRSWQYGAGGNAGKISIEAAELILTDGAILSSSAQGPGKGGDIQIKVSGTVRIEGVDGTGRVAMLTVESQAKDKDVRVGRGGNIIIEAKELIISKGAQVTASASAAEGTQSDGGGNINIRVSGAVKLSGVNPHGENTQGLGGGIKVSTIGGEAGDAGTISLLAGSLSITEGAVISSSTSNSAQGGAINIDIEGPVSISGNSAEFVLKEPVKSQLNFIKRFPDAIPNRLSVSGIYASSSSTADNAGQAGEIIVKANTVSLTKSGVINTSTQNAGGGNIIISTPNLLYLREGQTTTSVKGGTGRGGDITIESPLFVVLDKGQIKAQADAGRGGDIRIKSNQFIASPNSLVSASSRLGIDGEVEIDSPAVNMADFLAVLPGAFLDTSNQLKSPCNAQLAENLSSFVVVTSEGTANMPGDLLPSGPRLLPISLSPISPLKTRTTMNSTAAKRYPTVARLTGCQPKLAKP